MRCVEGTEATEPLDVAVDGLHADRAVRVQVDQAWRDDVGAVTDDGAIDRRVPGPDFGDDAVVGDDGGRPGRRLDPDQPRRPHRHAAHGVAVGPSRTVSWVAAAS